ncbi:MAG: HAD family hydrolase [Deltaproteobacteria bacterium]|nr:HAD family hydrolase [Deltaproteobacteria bacterium]
MTTYDLVIFDCDGVLVDTEPIRDEVVSFLLNESGLQVSPEEVARRSTGLADAVMWKMFQADLGSPLPVDILDRHLSMEEERYRIDLQPMPGAVEAVGHLVAAGMPVCVASNGTLERMEVTLGVTGLAGYFGNHVFGISQVDHGKPAPDIYLLAAQRMGVSPSRCAVIEDSRLGAEAGLAAGMTVLGYCPHEDLWGLEKLGVQTFSDMSVLAGLVGLGR